jgi:Mob1/phocein family
MMCTCVAVDFFNQINMLYGTITEFCTPEEVGFSSFSATLCSTYVCYSELARICFLYPGRVGAATNVPSSSRIPSLFSLSFISSLCCVVLCVSLFSLS